MLEGQSKETHSQARHVGSPSEVPSSSAQQRGDPSPGEARRPTRRGQPSRGFGVEGPTQGGARRPTKSDKARHVGHSQLVVPQELQGEARRPTNCDKARHVGHGQLVVPHVRQTGTYRKARRVGPPSEVPSSNAQPRGDPSPGEACRPTRRGQHQRRHSYGPKLADSTAAQKLPVVVIMQIKDLQSKIVANLSGFYHRARLL